MTIRPGALSIAVLLGALAMLPTACARRERSDAREATSTVAAPPTGATAPGGSLQGEVVLPGDSTVARAGVPAAGTVSDVSLRVSDGSSRQYRLYVPTGVAGRTDPDAVPLLVALHGGLGSARQFETTSGFDALAESNSFLVAYPDGIGAGPRGDSLRTWNAGECCGAAARRDVDDVGFIRQLIGDVSTRYQVDRSRIYVAGHSNGGMLAYRLACELSDKVVAIGVQSTALEMTSCQPDHHVSVLHLHGTGDRNIPIEGGNGADAVSNVAFNPPRQGPESFARNNGCGTDVTTSSDAANSDVTIASWPSCAEHTVVAFVEVAGAPHAWMGHPAPTARAGTPYERVDSSLTIWNFLAQRRR